MELHVKYPVFVEDLLSFQKQFEELSIKEIQSEADLKDVSERYKHLKNQCIEYLHLNISSDISENFISAMRVENNFHIPIQVQGQTILSQQQIFDNSVKSISTKIKERKGVIDAILKVISISDPLTNGRSYKEERSDMSVQEKQDFLLKKLYEIRKLDSYFDTSLIFRYNQVELDNKDDARGIAKSLKSCGYIDVQEYGKGSSAKITTDGKSYVEKFLLEVQGQTNAQVLKANLKIVNQNSYEVGVSSSNNNKVFIVHGHNELMKESVARFIGKLDLEPIILHEQANQGRTIIEKFQAHSLVGFAIVLVSADDMGYSKRDGEEKIKERARQNVIFELGYFYGKLGRDRVATLVEKVGKFELHSDIDGIAYIPYSSGESQWKSDLVKELKHCGYQIDANKMF